MSPSVYRQLASELRQRGHALWLLSEDVLREATALNEQARRYEALAEAEEAESAEAFADRVAARLYWGPDVRVLEEATA